MERLKDEFTKKWIIENAIPIINSYQKGVLTIRGLHYRLVSIGMTNSTRHYKRVVTSMISARWDGLVQFDSFVDNDRESIGETKSEVVDLYQEINSVKESIEFWMNNYFKNRWENQTYYPEVFIEKKALIGVFNPVCQKNDIALNPCKGYPSLTFLHDASNRFKNAFNEGKMPIILYFGDYDPSGEDIPRSIKKNLIDMGVDEIELKTFALTENQVIEWNLPPAPIKKGDSRSAKWGGLGQVELDAIEPQKLQELCQSAIDKYFDEELYNNLMDEQIDEEIEYKSELKKFASTL